MYLKHNFWNTDFHLRFCFRMVFYTSDCIKIITISMSVSLPIYTSFFKEQNWHIIVNSGLEPTFFLTKYNVSTDVTK